MQSLTPHMQLADAKITHKDSAKNYTNMSSSCDQEWGNLSLDIWKNAFREACERLCPIRAGGHECGCLSVLPKLVGLSSSFILSFYFFRLESTQAFHCSTFLYCPFSIVIYL